MGDRKGTFMRKIDEFCFGLEESIVMIISHINIFSKMCETGYCPKI